MTYFHEKTIFGVCGVLTWSVSTLGAVLVEDEALRYFYATFSMSILTAFFMALVFRKADETIRLVIGRCGLSILAGVFGTRFLIHYFELERASTDVITLMGLSGVVTMAGFLVGFALLKVLDRKSNSLAGALLKRWLPEDTGDKPRKE